MWKSANQGMKTRSRSQKSDDPGGLAVFSVMLRWSGYMTPGCFPGLCCASLDYGVSAVRGNFSKFWRRITLKILLSLLQ